MQKKISTPLPKDITAAIANGTYSSWKVSNDKEEIFKDTEKDDLKVYKVSVEKGREKHHLYYAANGDLLKDKTIK